MGKSWTMMSDVDLFDTDGPAPSPNGNEGLDGGRLRPDDVAEFRLAQLLILMAELHNEPALDLERLSVTDFMAANPHLVLSAPKFDLDRKRLINAGFNEHALAYASPGQRFATRRQRVLHDLAALVTYGLVRVEATGGRRAFVITQAGIDAAERLSSVYSDAFRISVAVIAPQVAALNDTALRRTLAEWLRADPMLFDLLDYRDDVLIVGTTS